MGEAGLDGAAGGGGGMAAEDLFAQFFGGGNGFGGMFGGAGGMRNQGPPKARTIHHTHKVSLEDIYRGKISKLALQRSIICPKCEGRGGKEGAVKKCAGCDGHGMKTMMRQMGPMIQRFQTACPDCNGEGEIIKDKDRCKQCAGKKTVVDRKVLHVNVDRGVKSGQRVEFRGEGDQAPGILAGDVIFEIEQKPHPRFTRKEDDLLYNCEIDLVTALAGGTIFVEHLDERWLSIEIIPGEAIAPGKLASPFTLAFLCCFTIWWARERLAQVSAQRLTDLSRCCQDDPRPRHAFLSPPRFRQSLHPIRRQVP